MDWVPQPKQELYLKNSAYEAMFGGAKGPGKTDGLLFDSTYQNDKPNYKALLLRRTFPKLQELIDRSHRWFHNEAHWSGAIKRWTWPSGAILDFGHCKNEEDKYNYQGKEYHYIGFDQLEEFTLNMYLFIMAQNRSSDPTVKCFIRSTSNPGNIGHSWVKDRFIERLPRDGAVRYFIPETGEEVAAGTPGSLSRSFIFATLRDNPALTNNDPLYEARLNMLPEKLRRALKEGDWDAYEGQYFSEWRRSIHIIPSFDLSQPHLTVLGLDYGFAKPASVGWYACLPDGNIIRYREYYKEGHTYASLADKILEINGSEKVEYMVADPAIWGDKSHHAEPKEGEMKGESGAETMQKILKGKIPLVMADNRRVIGWGLMREKLKPYSNQHNQLDAGFKVTENCHNFIRTMPGLIHDEANPEDLDTAGEDHAQDEARYVLMSRPRMPKAVEKTPTPTEDFWDRVKKDIKGNKEGEVVSITQDGARSL